MIVATLTALAALVWLQQWSLVRMGPRRAVGDEADYLESGSDPFMPRLFLRVPMMALVSYALRKRSPVEPATRALMAAVGVATAILVAGAAWVVAGWTGAFAGLMFLLLLPERLILNNHVWPDPFIALWLAAMNLVLVLPMAPGYEAAALGILVCLSALTRIDQMVLLVAVPWAFSLQTPLTLPHLLLICLPALAALTAWTLRNYRRHGIPLPDNTWIFNLQVAEQELESSEAVTRIDPLLQKGLPAWRDLFSETAHRQVFAQVLKLARRPWRFVKSVGKRAWSLLGPDTFVSERLLPPTGRAYPNMNEATADAWRIGLRISFPLVFAVLLVFVLSEAGPAPPFAIPTFCVFAAAAAIHSRTRYRLALLPGLALWMASSLRASFDRLLEPLGLVIMAAALIIGALSILLPGRREE